MKSIRAAAVVLAVVALTGCGGSEEPEPVPTTEAPISFTLEDYPRVDGSTATQPLGLAFKEAFTDTNLRPEDMPFSKTHQAYLKLIAGEVDLILVTSPSADELAAAQAAGVELEVIPVVHEGFVFITNAGNPVTSLTVGQLRDIYAGRTTNWRQVGGPDSPIVAYQRPPNSGSQTGILDLVMKGTPMMAAPQRVIESMEGTVDVVANYDNSSGALGYSYYYFVTAMYGELAEGNVQGGVRLMSVNGVAPTDETIRSGAYPLTSAYYIVIDKAAPADGPARLLARAMLSPQGQAVAQRAGYVPILDVPAEAPPTYVPPAAGPYSLSSPTEPYRLHPLRVTESHEAVQGADVMRLTVDGLADQRVEDAVNARLRQAEDTFVAAHHPSELWVGVTNAQTAYQPVPYGPSVIYTYGIYTYGNVVSFQISGADRTVVVNLRLDTGEEFTFADVFVDGASIEQILADAYWQTAVADGQEPADIETRLLDMVDDYRRDPRPQFFLVSADTMLVLIGGRQFTVTLSDYWQSIAIFKRFVTTGDDRLYSSTEPSRTCPAFLTPVGPEEGCY